MVSDNVKKARKIINRYPEIFESLLEFERTKKLPKLYRKKRLNITVDENVLREFKTYCEKRSINISSFIEKKIVERLKN